MKHILYIISYKNNKLIKIGKTRESNRENRYRQIKEDFKYCNFEKSYEIYSSEENIKNLERILHKLYYKERKPKYFKKGIGKTEWFNGMVLKTIFKEIKNIKKTNKTFSSLSNPIKGISIENKQSFKYDRELYLFILFFSIICLYIFFKDVNCLC